MYFKCANDLEDFITPHLNSLNDGSFEINIGDNKKPQQKGNRKKTVEKGTTKWNTFDLNLKYFIP